MAMQRQNIHQADFTPYINVIKKRKRLVILPLVIIMPIVTLILVLQEPVYKSTAAILIEPENPNIVGFQEVLKLGPYDAYFQTQYQLISSRPMIEKTLDALNQDNNNVLSTEERNHYKELFLGSNYLTSYWHNCRKKILSKIKSIKDSLIGRDNESTHSSTKRIREKNIEKFQEALTVKPIPNTRLIHVTVSDSNPYKTTRWVNTLAEVYTAQNLKHKIDGSEQASLWLTKLVEDLKNPLQNAEHILEEFIKEHGLATAELGEIQSVALAGLRDLNKEYIAAKIHRFDLETQLKELERLQLQSIDNDQSLARTLSDSVISNLLMRFANMKGQQAKIAKRFKQDHPQFIAVNAELQQIQEEINTKIQQNIQSVHTQLNTAIAKEETLLGELNVFETKGLRVDKNIAKYTTLKSNVDNKRALYQDMVRRLSETNITKGLEANNIRIVQRGTVPIEPVSSWIFIKLVGSSILTLSLGIALTFLAELFNKGFRNTEEVEQYLQIPFLGIIPRYAVNQRRIDREINNKDYPDGDFVAYRLLRMNLQFIATQRPIVSLLVTSAAPNEGKSTTVANLGISFALLGKKVLLVDADLHRPTLHKIFNLKNTVGLSDTLTEHKPWHTHIQKTNTPNLSVLASGSSSVNPTELLCTMRMHEFNNEIRNYYDMILYDAPMIISLPDAAILSTEMDGVLLVHNLTVGNKETVVIAKQILERANANILGLIFNNVDLKKMGFYSYQYEYYNKDKGSQNLLVEPLNRTD